MAPATAASRRPVVDLDETGFSIAPVNLCRSGYRYQMQSHLKPKLPDMLIAVDFRDGSSLKAIWEDLYVQ
jgi:hypothetical protein